MGIGKNIKKYRQNGNLTQKELANILFVSAQAVSRWERDEVEPDFATIMKMCTIFNCTAEDLASGIDDEKIDIEVPVENVQSVSPRLPYFGSAIYSPKFQPFYESYGLLNGRYAYSFSQENKIKNNYQQFIFDKNYTKTIRMSQDTLIDFFYDEKRQVIGFVYQEAENFIIPVETIFNVEMKNNKITYKNRYIDTYTLEFIINCPQYQMETKSITFYGCSLASIEKWAMRQQSFYQNYDIYNVRVKGAIDSVIKFIESTKTVKQQILNGTIEVEPVSFTELEERSLQKNKEYAEYAKKFKESEVAKTLPKALENTMTYKYKVGEKSLSDVRVVSQDDGSSGAGFALGFFLGIIGLIFALVGGKSSTKSGAIGGFIVWLILDAIVAIILVISLR